MVKYELLCQLADFVLIPCFFQIVKKLLPKDPPIDIIIPRKIKMTKVIIPLALSSKWDSNRF